MKGFVFKFSDRISKKLGASIYRDCGIENASQKGNLRDIFSKNQTNLENPGSDPPQIWMKSGLFIHFYPK